MRFLGRVIFSILSNTLGILAASYLIAGFVFSGTFKELVIAGVIVTAINFFIKPIVKLIFGPLIVLTLGLFLIVINALTVYLLDFFMESITISGPIPLLLATLLIGAINFIIGFSAKSMKSGN